MLRWFVFSFFLFPLLLNAQHVGTDFRIAFLRNLGPGNPQPSTEFSIFALEDAQVTVVFSTPLNPLFQSQTISIAAGEVGVVSFPNVYLNQNNLGIAEQRSFRITSTAPVRVQAYQFRGGFSEGTPVLPVTSLGSEYIVVNYRSATGEPSSQFNIVAVQNNTVISIEQVSNTQLGGAGSTVNITLNEGEVVSLGSIQNSIGTKISSQDGVPFAVFAGGEFMAFQNGCTGGANLFEQMLPTSLWGTVHPMITSVDPNLEGLVFVVLEPNTTLQFGCGPAVVSQHELCDECTFKSNFALFISSAPISVAQINPTATCGIFDKGTTNMRLLEPLSRGNTVHKFRAGGDFSLGYNPNTSFNVVHLALPNADTSGVLVNGNPVSGWIGSSSIPQAWAARVELGAINELTTITSNTPVWANYLALQPNDAITMSLGSNAQNELPQYENLFAFLPDSVRLCEGETLLLDPGLNTPGQWQDGSVQNTFVVTEPGVYYVDYENGCLSSRDTVRVRPGIVLLELADEVNACPGETVVLSPDTVRHLYTYQWTGQNEGSTLETNVAGTYTITATNQLNGCTIDGQINYIPFPTPPIEINDFVGLCPDDTLSLEAAGTGSWLWSTGDTLSRIHVTLSGTYVVSLTDSLGCVGQRNITVIDSFLPLIFPEEFLVCTGESTEVEILSPNADVTWINPPLLNPAMLGEGIWEFVASNECGMVSAVVEVGVKECKCDALIPNIFSPNGDGLNDIFLPQVHCETEHYSLTIFNRWGSEIYTSLNKEAGWNGRIKDGVEAPDGVYFYVLSYRNDLRKDKAILNYSGTVTLTR